MKIDFTAQDGAALYDLLADHCDDIVLKTDRRGFIVHASPAVQRLGLLPPGMLIWPHLLDLVHPQSADRVRSVLEGEGHAAFDVALVCGRRQERWFALRMRPLLDRRGRRTGCIAVLRCIEDRRVMQEELFAARLTDPLTGLTNRTAFTAMLDYMIDHEMGGSLAVFAIDWLTAINLRHGQGAGDAVLTGFAGLLRELTRSEDILSRVAGERFAVMFRSASNRQAEAIAHEIVASLAGLTPTGAGGPVPVTASAAVVRIGTSRDETLGRAELTLFRARAKGRNRVEGEGNEEPQWPVARVA